MLEEVDPNDVIPDDRLDPEAPLDPKDVIPDEREEMLDPEASLDPKDVIPDDRLDPEASFDPNDDRFAPDSPDVEGNDFPKFILLDAAENKDF